MADELDVIKETLKNYRGQLLDRANVVAAGIGYKTTGGQQTSALSIVCSVTSKISASQLSNKDLVPGSLAGTPTDVIETGVIRALQSPTERHRPAPGGRVRRRVQF